MKKLLDLKDIFAACDKIAIGAINLIKDEGLGAPEDISIIGFDYIEIAQYLTPRLTTIRQNCNLIGSTAADLLIEQINKKTKLTINKIILVEFIERDSCRKIE
jgi:DNA-binding LacI/PurR family transcriptional regulator